MNARYFIILLMVILLVLPAGAQEKEASDIQAMMHSEESNLKAYIKQGIEPTSSAFNGIYYKLVRFHDNSTRENLSKLRKHGAEIHTYWGDDIYLVSFPLGFNLSLLRDANVHSVYELKADMKFSDAFKTDSIGEKIDDAEDIEWKARILPYERFLEHRALIERLLEEKGCAISDLGNHKAIHVSASLKELRHVAELPCVKRIRSIPPELEPQSLFTDNHYSPSTSQRVNVYRGGNHNYDGSGIKVAVGDDGIVSHPTDFRGRLENNTQSVGNDHADHISGIIGGAGNRDPVFEGNAPGVDKLYIYDATDLYNKLDSYFSRDALITNFSFGKAPETSLFNIYYASLAEADYDHLAVQVDSQIRAHTPLMHVMCAGNYGESVPVSGSSPGWATLSMTYQYSKNSISVGRVFLGDNVTTSSSRGPTKDGRLKPEVTALGTRISSTIGEYYQLQGGTSQSSPAAAGGLAVMYNAYKTLNGGQNPHSALMKAILMNSADDLDGPGPNFKSGFGRINIRQAINTIRENRYHKSSHTQEGYTNAYGINVPANVEQLKVMLYWHDPPADPSAVLNGQDALVNDLDLSVLDPSLQKTYPWFPDPAPPLVYSDVSRQRDGLNNVEQVTIDNPAPGNYVLDVKAHDLDLSSVPQSYFLTWEFITSDIKVTYPNGGESLLPSSNDDISDNFGGDKPGTKYLGQHSEMIHWDCQGTSSPFNIYVSYDNGATWNTIEVNYDGDRRTYQWLVPDTIATSNAIIRVSRSLSDFDVSDSSFSIMGRPLYRDKDKTSSIGLETDRNIQIYHQCDSLFLKWDTVKFADAYRIWELGPNDEYMQPLGTVDSARGDSVVYTLNYEPYEVERRDFAIQAYDSASGAWGLRSISLPGSEMIKDENGPKVELPFNDNTALICDGEDLSRDISATTDNCSDCLIEWSTGDDSTKTITIESAGTYNVTVTDITNGCEDSDEMRIGVRITDCDDDGDDDDWEVPIRQSFDPNDILGPEGYGPAKWVSVNDRLNYTVRFENDPDFATAPAQRVKVTHPIDDKAERFSFQLGNFGFANYTFQVPPNSNSYSTRIDLTDSLGIFLDVTAGLDVVNDEAFWILQSIDPQTGVAPADPNKGFLKVNDTAIGDGEGFVDFSIKPVSNAQTRDTIEAIADIVFDDNASIKTPVWKNVIDALPPVSVIDSLPPNTDTSSFVLSWAAQDDPLGSGLAEYDLYGRQDSTGPFTLFQSGITDTFTNFSGSNGAFYEFFVEAIDNVGNTENKQKGEQSTFIEGVQVQLKVLLDGAYEPASQLMRDDLRKKDLLPNVEPYSFFNFSPANGAVRADSAVLAQSGNDAVVDWVLVELRDQQDSSNILTSRAVLVQRDGDVIAPDGSPSIKFTDVDPAQYFVAIRHYNHLGVMAKEPVDLSLDTAFLDFTAIGTSVFGSDARKMQNGKAVLWAGNVNFDGVIKYSGPDNDRDKILTKIGGTVPTATKSGYFVEDVNMDGIVKYAGFQNDRDIILMNIGGNVPTATRVEQLP